MFIYFLQKTPQSTLPASPEEPQSTLPASPEQPQSTLPASPKQSESELNDFNARLGLYAFIEKSIHISFHV